MNRLLLVLVLLTSACGDDVPAASSTDAFADVEADADTTVADATAPLALTVVTFNTGGGAYTEEHADALDDWYGNGLSFPDLIDETRAFLTEVDPDVVVFQEIFYSGECPDIPEAFHDGFVCASWEPGDPTVVELLFGDGWQIACHPGNPDKCAAINRRLGTFRGCEADFCVAGLSGFGVDGCGSGARVARGVVDLAGGSALAVVNYHGTSGVTDEEADCRARQVDQVFVDLGDGEPGANGDLNLIMGDLNTDPGRMWGVDASSDRWLAFVGEEHDFHFVSDVGESAEPTYAGFFNIDHVISDAFDGTCWVPGITDDTDPVIDTVFFDHAPVICDVTVP